MKLIPLLLMLCLPIQAGAQFEERIMKHDLSVLARQQAVRDSICDVFGEPSDRPSLEDRIAALGSRLDSLEAKYKPIKVWLRDKARHKGFLDIGPQQHWEIGISSRVAYLEMENDSLKAKINRAHVVVHIDSLPAGPEPITPPEKPWIVIPKPGIVFDIIPPIYSGWYIRKYIISFEPEKPDGN